MCNNVSYEKAMKILLKSSKKKGVTKKCKNNEPVYFYWESINGESGYYLSISKFAKERNLNNSHISECIKGIRNIHKGYTFRKCTEKEIQENFN